MRRVQGEGAGRLDRLGAGAAVPALAAGGDNTRFLILPAARVPNLASRVLALSARRLSSDMEAALGHPALLAETFYAKSHGRWVAHGQPKRVFALPLAPGALEALRGLDEPAALLRSLRDFLRQVPECRRRRGLTPAGTKAGRRTDLYRHQYPTTIKACGLRPTATEIRRVHLPCHPGSGSKRAISPQVPSAASRKRSTSPGCSRPRIPPTTPQRLRVVLDFGCMWYCQALVQLEGRRRKAG